MDWELVGTSAGLKDPPLSVVDPPVFISHPCLPFVRMTATGPGKEHAKEYASYFLEDLLAGAGGKIVTPPYDLAAQELDKRLLIHRPVLPQDQLQPVGVSLDGCFAGFDDRLEAQRNASRRKGTPSLASRVLPDVKTQEVEPWPVVSSFPGVDHPGL
jgi:hypothetical protein